MSYEVWEKRIIGIIGCYELFEEGYENKPRQTYPEELTGKDHKTICSNQTLYRIGKGQIIPSDKVYDELPVLLLQKNYLSKWIFTQIGNQPPR